MLTIVLSDGGRHLLPQARELIMQAGFDLIDAEAQAGVEPLEVIRTADALLTFWYPVREEVINQLEHCKLIVRIGIGTDTVDLESASRRGIPVSNVPDYCLDEVADHAFALALALLRQLPILDRTLRGGAWAVRRWQPIHSYANMTFATLGFGRIAQGVLSRAVPSKFKVAACDPYQPNSAFEALGVQRMTLDGLFREADILSLHAPLTPETRHIVNAEHLAQMKPTAMIVNTARGPLIDTVALAEALQTRKIAAAGLDVFEKEPEDPNHPLFQCENAIFTPHQAWYSEESLVKLHTMAAEEAVRALRGEPLRSCVNGLGMPVTA